MSRHIDNKRVLNISSRLEGFVAAAEIRVVIDIDEAVRTRLPALGWVTHPATGDTILPAAVGPVSRFNAEGRWVALRDQPKESRYIGTVRWKWTTWAGRDRTEEHEDDRDIYRQCYPRDLIPPPAFELTFVEMVGKGWIVSRAFRNVPEDHAGIRHAVNLFLELFRSCDLVGADMKQTGDVPIRHVNWRLLPPGEYPWDRLGEHLGKMLQGRPERTASVIMDRQETIKSFGPVELHVGTGGFRDYIAYLFPAKGLVVLESVQRDNAIYVFGQNWQGVSRLSKAEVIAGKRQIARIVHSSGWKESLARLLLQADAAE